MVVAVLGIILLALVSVSSGSTSVDQQPAEATTFERLDQSQTGRVTTFHIPSSGVWQSFTAGLTGNLTRLDVLLGQAKPGDTCNTYDGDLVLYEGSGRFQAPFFSQHSQLTSQRVVGSECRCTSKDCVVWQSFVLSSAVPVVAGERYSFFLSPPHRHRRISFRVGLAVADLYTAGSNHFAAPGYDFTFKTYVNVDSDAVDLSQQEDSTQPTGSPEGSTAEPTDRNASNSAGSAVQTSLLVAGLVCAATIFVVLVMAFVRRQRRRGARVLALGTFAPRGTGDKNSRMRGGDAADVDAVVFDDLFYHDDDAAAAGTWRQTFEAALDGQPVQRAWDAESQHFTTTVSGDAGLWQRHPSPLSHEQTEDGGRGEGHGHGCDAEEAAAEAELHRHMGGVGARAAQMRARGHQHTVLWLEFNEPSAHDGVMMPSTTHSGSGGDRGGDWDNWDSADVYVDDAHANVSTT
ncbi:hypothetical protein PTSG_04934 [Salpingoeca rosetta]|uniref:Uncharacterized protein n=1 Tax=Salpingoeca rosetta (strain ATCC 50818 / BSB-021) TaxID=946362 RepID=F2U916_SALR5|nr:uncharacterized protein PTSG_04934 [Salpingoeca rosetta]EGD73219.1 hypothetical protein PTSG_04934 [Salpingoeca rosetta]|eukprot:XP_004994250.1 hypothetical protein PTSG_04934 [Salpingoeca rosetta]